MRISPVRALVLGALTLTVLPGGAAAKAPARSDAVVVATLTSGTNPFHPCFRRAGLADPGSVNRNYPKSSKALRLSFRSTYAASLAASHKTVAGMRADTLYHVPGTNLSYYGAADGLVDEDGRGTRATSQIACPDLSLAPDAHLVVVRWPADTTAQSRVLDWVREQKWIDIVHVDVHALDVVGHPALSPMSYEKPVVVPAGDGAAGLAYPAHVQGTNVGQSLIVGANDNGGWTTFSNLDPVLVMDGVRTVAADAFGYGRTASTGTAGAAARAAGYLARVVGDLRVRFRHDGWPSLVSLPWDGPMPSSGPLRDSVLDTWEFLYAVRHTADPNPHDSRFDGGSDPATLIPQPAALPVSFYPKMGFGEVSERTVAAARAVAAGDVALPPRAEWELWHAHHFR